MLTSRRVTLAAGLVTALAMGVGLPIQAAAEKRPKSAPNEAPAPPAPPPIPESVQHPDIPPIPKPPKPPTTTPRYNLKKGESHKGDLYFFSDTVTIAGTQEGDLIIFSRTLDVPGTVTGDVMATVESADLSGTMGDTVRVFCKDLRVSGTIEGDLVAMCATVNVEKGSRVMGDLSAKGASIDLHGDVDGEVEAMGGEVRLSGTVGGDAEVKADVVEIEPGTRIKGDLSYTSRSRVEIDDHDAVGGEVIYTPGKKKPPVSTGGFFKWFLFMATAFLSGLGALAIFRKNASAIVGAVRGDGLRSAGIGFITTIVVPVAALLSCILIITIPAAILAMLAFCLTLYLSQVPVAVWLGESVLRRLGRANASPFLALALGMPLMYVVFSIPFIGKVALFAVIFTGFGAIVITLWASHQARRAGGAPLAPPPVATAAV
ncbi:MAG TPA: polymer-forming cytoskeletal protein [Candidatus Cryosericum sp.]|nr:polymer-forming cytoskeletal protein [Candidatus Cryosericum sp.]